MTNTKRTSPMFCAGHHAHSDDPDRNARGGAGGVPRVRPALLALALASLFAGSQPGAAQSVVHLGGSDTARPAATGTGAGCDVDGYHAALGKIRSEQYAAIKTAKDTALQPDETLPGRLIYTPIVPPRSTEGRKALMAASQLARMRNRPAWTASTDARWVMGEVSNELGRYLGQEKTAYLCYGVPDYMKTMRGYLARAGGDVASLDALKSAEADIASKTILATLSALRPVPLPTPAPTDHGMAAGQGDLRPAVGTGASAEAAPASAGPGDGTPSAETGATAAETPVTASAASGTDADVGGDLAPLTEPTPIPLASDDDRLAALDRLVDAARRSGALPEDDAAPAGPGTTASLDAAGAPTANDASPASRPVLARLQALRPLVYGSQSPISDVAVRRRLIDGFSAIEIVDYLDHRPAESADSVPAAIGRTLDAIEAAHAATCGCGGN
ncbi:hypothetical protein [Jiella sonneratiae]|uniref:Uncharacterized protein n=1 Tax=Jiella sonneratiae TaxID=2816856 RepID=A0ABS3J5K9_9HYPH|nr:hypothetical protein [Jiella sonneratiae]MBO0904966.1 hypothetical protein [Jiella sonneratiae]